MTEQEIKDIAKIMKTADDGCRVCVRLLLEKFAKYLLLTKQELERILSE